MLHKTYPRMSSLQPFLFCTVNNNRLQLDVDSLSRILWHSYIPVVLGSLSQSFPSRQVLFAHNDEGPKVAHWAKEILRPCTTDAPLTALEDEVPYPFFFGHGVV